MKTGFKIKIKLLFLENQLHLEAKEKKDQTNRNECNQREKRGKYRLANQHIHFYTVMWNPN